MPFEQSFCADDFNAKVVLVSVADLGSAHEALASVFHAAVNRKVIIDRTARNHALELCADFRDIQAGT